MNTKEINEELVNWKYYVGAFAIDKIPNISKRPISMIVNTDPSSMPGEHWIAIYLEGNKKGEYFDSFGFPPRDGIKEFLNEQCPDGWRCSNIMLQQISAITCGAYCVMYIKMRSLGYTLKQFILLFTMSTPVNELILGKLYKML